jgi:predicted Zn-dependent protease
MALRLPRKLVVKVRILAVAVTAVAMVGMSAAPAEAQQRQLQFIRDAEIEHIIRTYAEPIFEVAGINGDNVEIALVKDNSLNAFVAGGMNLFIHTGLLQESQSPGELIGVVAHEIGHIAGGHLIRTQEAMEGASAQAILSALLGLGAALATGQAGAGAAIIGGGTEMARRSYLAYSRAQEGTADQAALSYMDQAGISARGLLNFLEKLAGQDLRPTDRQDAFVRTHPLTLDRIESVRYHVERSAASNKTLPAAYDDMHARMRAKLLGFIQPLIALQRFPESDTALPARYGRAIALYQRGDIKQALQIVDQLIKEEPDNPFFYELKGQILLENSRVAESLPPYRRSVELLPDSALLRSSLAHALVESNDDRVLNEALKHLKVAAEKEPRTPFTWRLIATVYGRQNQQGMLSYALAEEAMARGDRGVARFHAEKAEHELPVGSPSWIRAQDIRTATDRPPKR